MTEMKSEDPQITVRCQFCLKWNRVRASRVANRPQCGECKRPMLLDRPLKLGEDEFDRTVSGTGIPLLVDFYADWCGPCKMMAPVLDSYAARMQGRVLVCKVDTDLAPSISQRFDIRSIPTLIVFRSGEESDRRMGAVPERELDAMVGS